MNASKVERAQRSFEAVPASARAARQFVVDTLRQQGADEQVVADYALVVSELATNIIEHGDGSALVIYVDAGDPNWWELEVAGGSPGCPDGLREPDTWRVASAEETSGRGLGIVRHLIDDITTGTNAGQASIRCRRRRHMAAPLI
ncbi:MAG TPA: ATP-binding protein [Ilumatobacteraceae bacterium]|jgi:anti-sigma regulatory factor (Ser/Thr protein kinase)